MARWSRLQLGAIGFGVLAALTGTLAVPLMSNAAAVPASSAASSATPKVTTADRIVTFAGSRGRSAFEFQPASGDRQAPYGFVSTGGTVQARQLGSTGTTVARAATAAGAPTVPSVSVAAATYKTTLTIDSENGSAWNSVMNLWNRDTWTYVSVTQPLQSRSTSVKLPAGKYYATAIYGGVNGMNSYLLTKSFTVSNKAQTVHLAEKSAKEVAIKVTDTSTQLEQSGVWLSLPNDDQVGFAGGQRSRTYATTASLAGTALHAHVVLHKPGSTVVKPSPYRYDLFKSWSHPLPASPITTVKTSSLARTTLAVKAQGINSDGWYLTALTGEGTNVALPTPVRAPSTITEYVTPGVAMSRLVDYDNGQRLIMRDRSLPAGVSAGETVGAGPLGPNTWTTDGDHSRRGGGKMYVREYRAFGDGAGNVGYDFGAATSTRLSTGGEVLGTSTTTSLSVAVPSAEQTYQLKHTTTRKVPWSQLSTKVQSEWKFVSSGQSPGDLPLIDLAVNASGLGQRNQAGTAPVQLTVTPSTRKDPAVSTVTSVEWSVDDGATWTELPLTPSGSGVKTSLTVPGTAAFVSLRFTASNDQGGALTRTVTHALAGPASPGNKTTGSTTISALKVNGGRPLVVVPRAAYADFQTARATFTVSDPAGIPDAGLVLWHGTRNAPDGLLSADASCIRSTATTSKCTADVYFYDPKYTLSKNALAGPWQAEVWASAADGTSFTDLPAAGSLIFKRDTRLSTDATPEPVKKGKTITITGSLTRSDWSNWTFKPYASRTVTLQQAKAGTSTWTDVKKVKTNAKGVLKTTVKATADGSLRWTWAGDATSDSVTSAADAIDVR